MSSTPPQTAKHPAVQPPTPDTPYHSVKETGTGNEISYTSRN